MQMIMMTFSRWSYKTRHWYFVVGTPLILVVQIGIGALICNRINSEVFFEQQNGKG